MSFGIDFCFILGAFWHNFLYFFVTDFSMNLRLYFLWIFDQNGSPKTTPGGSKNSVPLRRFLVRLLLGHPGSERGGPEPHFGHPGSQKGAPERHFGCSFLHFFLNLFAGRQHRGDTENMDETIQQPRTKGSTLATQHTQTCHPRHLGGVFKAGEGGR